MADGSGFLGGVTVLDLSTVGPASRCSRILADYGAAVVKVGPPPAKSGVQIQPPVGGRLRAVVVPGDAGQIVDQIGAERRMDPHDQQIQLDRRGE